MRWAFADAALTKCFEPSAQVSTEAKPGVKPPPWETASTTGDPQCRSTRPRTCWGRCGQVSRCAVRPWGIVVGMAVTRSSFPTAAHAREAITWGHLVGRGPLQRSGVGDDDPPAAQLEHALV